LTPTAKARLPAISRELEFIASRYEQADEILSDDIKVDTFVKDLTRKVYERANRDVLTLLNQSTESVSRGIRGAMRIDWDKEPKIVDWSDVYWGRKGKIFMARGPKKEMGRVGLHVGSGNEGFRLVGWVFPRRVGLDVRAELAHTCKKQMPEVHLASEHKRRYPGWIGYNDAVVWLDHSLSQNDDLGELQKKITTKAKRFFKFAKPILKNLAVGRKR